MKNFSERSPDDVLAGELLGLTRPVKSMHVEPLPHPADLRRSMEQRDAMSVSRFYCSRCGHLIRITEKAVHDLSELAGLPVPSEIELAHTYFLVRACLLCSDHYDDPKLLEIPAE